MHGGLVASHSWDDGLVPGDTNDSFDVFVLDRNSGALERVSVDSASTHGNDWSIGASITPDARFVDFTPSPTTRSPATA